MRAPSPPMSRLSSKAPGSNWMPPEPPADSARPTATAASDAAAPAAGPAAATSSSVSLPHRGMRTHQPADKMQGLPKVHSLGLRS